MTNVSKAKVGGVLSLIIDFFAHGVIMLPEMAASKVTQAWLECKIKHFNAEITNSGDDEAFWFNNLCSEFE